MKDQKCYFALEIEKDTNLKGLKFLCTEFFKSEIFVWGKLHHKTDFFKYLSTSNVPQPIHFLPNNTSLLEFIERLQPAICNNFFFIYRNILHL